MLERNNYVFGNDGYLSCVLIMLINIDLLLNHNHCLYLFSDCVYKKKEVRKLAEEQLREELANQKE